MRYVRFNTGEKKILKIKRKIFTILRNRGYTKIFLARLFSKIKFVARNELLAISADSENYWDTDNNRSDTFSEVEIPRENFQNNNIRICSVFSPISLSNKSEVSC